MSEKSTVEAGPDSIETGTLDSIVDMAIDLVDANKVDDPESEYDSARFYVSGYENPDDPNKVPTLSISIPKEQNAERYKWRAEFSFANQDPNTSAHVLIRNDGNIVVAGYNGQPDQIMNQVQANALLVHLKDIEPTLIPDPS